MGNTYDFDDDDGNVAIMKMITMVMIMAIMMTYLGGLPINGNCGKVEEGAN